MMSDTAKVDALLAQGHEYQRTGNRQVFAHNLTITEEPLGGIPKVCRGCGGAGKCSPGSVKNCEDAAAAARIRRAARMAKKVVTPCK